MVNPRRFCRMDVFVLFFFLWTHGWYFCVTNNGQTGTLLIRIDAAVIRLRETVVSRRALAGNWRWRRSVVDWGRTRTPSTRNEPHEHIHIEHEHTYIGAISWCIFACTSLECLADTSRDLHLRNDLADSAAYWTSHGKMENWFPERLREKPAILAWYKSTMFKRYKRGIVASFATHSISLTHILRW